MTLRETVVETDVVMLVVDVFVGTLVMVTGVEVTGFYFGLAVVELLAGRYFCKCFVAAVSGGVLVEGVAEFVDAALLVVMVVAVV